MPRSLKASTWWVALRLTPLLSMLSSSDPAQAAMKNESNSTVNNLLIRFVIRIAWARYRWAVIDVGIISHIKFGVNRFQVFMRCCPANEPFSLKTLCCPQQACHACDKIAGRDFECTQCSPKYRRCPVTLQYSESSDYEIPPCISSSFTFTH